MKKFILIAPLLGWLGPAAFCKPFPAEAAFYRYTDKNGVVHFTDRFESIPPEYRKQVREYKEIKQPEALPAPQKPESKDPGGTERDRQAREAEQRKKESEARAALEKAVQEARQKAREEKLKQIDALQAQIAAKQKEAAGLRTNWMVYDRIRLNQLNEEISSLGKQIEAVQKELSD